MRGDKTIARILALPGVAEIWNEGRDGWWLALTPGWCCPMMECHTVHEYTLGEVLSVARCLTRCACPECAKANVELPAADVTECRCSWGDDR